MLVSVASGKIRLALDVGEEEEQLRVLAGAIGTARWADDGAREATCSFSVVNLQKIKRLFPHAEKAADVTTVAAIDKIKQQRQQYLAECALAERVKAGEIVYSGYEFKLPPYAHQKIIFQFLHAITNPGIFTDCGGGKTFCVSTYLDSLIKRGDRCAFLVVCPPNLIRRVWLADVAKFTDLTAVSLRVDASDAKKRAAKRAAAFAQNAHVYVINPESIRIARKDRKGGDKLDLVFQLLKRLRKEGTRIKLVIDESSKLKSPQSATFKAINDIAEYCDGVIEMTGTPSPNGILDLWTQFYVLDRGMTLQPSFPDYRHDTHHHIQLKGVTVAGRNGQKIQAMKWSPKKGSAMEVHRLIRSRVIRFRTEDCIDLPPRTFITREVEMSAEQRTVYDEMENRLFVELEGEPVTARIAATRLLKLRQITGGFLITDSEEAIAIGKESPKALELDQILEQSIADKLGDAERTDAPNKAIVWAQYRWECRMLVARYARFYGARGLFGGISYANKDKSLEAFDKDPSCRLLICHEQSVGHGLTLTSASYAIWYSLSNDYEGFYQAGRRIARPGQHRPMFFYFLVAPKSIDEDCLVALAAKKDVSDLVTDGAFDRHHFLKRRQSAAQIDLSWGVPHELAQPQRTEGAH